MRADATEFFPSSTLRADGRLLLPASASPSPPPPPPPPCSSPSPCSAAPPPHAAASFSSSSSSYSPSTAREPRLRSSPQHSRSSPSSSRLVGSLSSPPSEDPYKEGLRRHNHKPYTSHRANQGHRSVVDAPSEDNAPPRSTRGTSSSSSTASLSTTPSVHSAAGRGRGRRREEVHLSSREKVLSPQRFFTYKPYVPSTGRGWSGERAEKRTGRVKGSRPSNKFYSKERFVLANCRVFIRNETTVSDAGYNPDCSIDWTEVVKVETWSSAEDPLNCPFCLEQPEGMLAPTVGKCGHIFCLPCVLKYFEVLASKPSASSAVTPQQLKTSQRYWQRCPLCFEPITKKDLRPALVHQVVPPQRGSVLTFSLLSRPLSSTVVQLAKPFTTQAAACAAGPDLSSSSSFPNRAPTPSSERESVLVSPKGGGREEEDKKEKERDEEKEFKSHHEPSQRRSCQNEEDAVSSSAMTEGGEKRTELSSLATEKEFIGTSSTLFSRSFLPFQCPACAVEHQAKLLIRRQKSLRETPMWDPVETRQHDCEEREEVFASSSCSGSRNESSTQRVVPSDLAEISSSSSSSSISSFPSFLTLGARLTRRLCLECKASAVSFSARRSRLTDSHHNQEPHSRGECFFPPRCVGGRAGGEDRQTGTSAAQKKLEGGGRQEDGGGEADQEETEGADRRPRRGEREEAEEETGVRGRGKGGGDAGKTRGGERGEGGAALHAGMAGCCSPGVPCSSSLVGSTTSGGEAELEGEEAQRRDVRPYLPCDLTLGSHFSRISLTHAPASPWQSHARQLANAKRQIEGSAEKSSDDISTLHALAMAEEFAQVKEREMSGGSCYACSAPLASSSPSTWSPAFSSSSSSSSTHGFRHESAAVSGGARRGSSSTGEQREGDEEKEDGQRQRKYLSFQHLNETQGIECEDNLQGFVQVLDAIQKRQRAEKLLKAQTRKKQLKKNQASQQGYSSSSSSSSASSDLASFPPTLDAASASPPTTTGTPSSSSASPTNPVREEEKRAESTRGDDECNSILSTRNSQGRHEKIKGGGASLHLSEFYFYQASDGQLCFLHPFFIKCLLHEVEGEESDLPAVIPDVRVVDVQHVCVDEVLRRRFKCLGHLPQMSQATLVDINLRGWLSPSTVKVFKDDFYRRKIARQERQQQEEREASAMLNHSSGPAASLSSSSSLPSYTQRSFRITSSPPDPPHPPTDRSLTDFPSLPRVRASPRDHFQPHDDASLQEQPTSSSFSPSPVREKKSPTRSSRKEDHVYGECPGKMTHRKSPRGSPAGGGPAKDVEDEEEGQCFSISDDRTPLPRGNLLGVDGIGHDSSTATTASGSGSTSASTTSSSFVMIVTRKEEEAKLLREQKKREEHFPSLAAASAQLATGSRRGGEGEPERQGQASWSSVWGRKGNGDKERLLYSETEEKRLFSSPTEGGRGGGSAWGGGINRTERKASSQQSSLLLQRGGGGSSGKKPQQGQCLLAKAKGAGGREAEEEKDLLLEESYLPQRAGGCNLGEILLMQQKTQKKTKRSAKAKGTNGKSKNEE